VPNKACRLSRSPSFYEFGQNTESENCRVKQVFFALLLKLKRDREKIKWNEICFCQKFLASNKNQVRTSRQTADNSLAWICMLSWKELLELALNFGQALFAFSLNINHAKKTFESSWYKIEVIFSGQFMFLII